MNFGIALLFVGEVDERKPVTGTICSKNTGDLTAESQMGETSVSIITRLIDHVGTLRSGLNAGTLQCRHFLTELFRQEAKIVLDGLNPA